MVAFLASQGGNTVGPPVLEIAEFSSAENLASPPILPPHHEHPQLGLVVPGGQWPGVQAGPVRGVAGTVDTGSQYHHQHQKPDRLSSSHCLHCTGVSQLSQSTVVSVCLDYLLSRLCSALQSFNLF